MYKIGDIIKDFIGNEYKVLEEPKEDFIAGTVYKVIDQQGIICIVDEQGVFQDDICTCDFDVM